MPFHRLVLASASPRRLRLLREIGLDPLVLPVSIEERGIPGESAREMVLRLSEAKGRAAAGSLPDSGESSLILAADTAVVLGKRVLGKPRSAEEAHEMLRRLRRRAHEVLTGVFLLRTDDGRSVRAVESSRVRFRDYEDQAILDYVAGGEPMDKAGAYAIQGGGARFVEVLEGSRSNVIGLPVERMAAWLDRIGLRTEQLRPRDQELDSTNCP
jgi:septum formation protein